MTSLLTPTAPPVAVVTAIARMRTWLDRLRRRSAPPAIALLEMGLGHWMAQALMVAAELGVADHLTPGPLPVSRLAALVGAHEESLYRLLRALAGVDVFVEGPERVFALTPLARPLTSDAHDSVRTYLVMNRQAFHWRSWGDLNEVVRGGASALELREGQHLFDYLASHPADGRTFDAGMTAVSAQSAPFVAQALDFSRFGTVADIGGGHGHFLAAILGAHAGVRGVLFDRPHVVADAAEVLRRHGVLERCRIDAGSFMVAVPGGADAFILKNVLHDWNDDTCARILGNVRRAMAPHARLLVVETVVPEGNGYHAAKLVDLEMLVHTPGGRERTRRQHEALLERAGFTLVSLHRTAALECVIEAAPATGAGGPAPRPGRTAGREVRS